MKKNGQKKHPKKQGSKALFFLFFFKKKRQKKQTDQKKNRKKQKAIFLRKRVQNDPLEMGSRKRVIFWSFLPNPQKLTILMVFLWDNQNLVIFPQNYGRFFPSGAFGAEKNLQTLNGVFLFFFLKKNMFFF